MMAEVTLPSPLNAPEDQPTAHGVVELWDDKIVIQGRGILKSRELPVTPRTPQTSKL